MEQYKVEVKEYKKWYQENKETIEAEVQRKNQEQADREIARLQNQIHQVGNNLRVWTERLDEISMEGYQYPENSMEIE
jgi:hypothetical protein